MPADDVHIKPYTWDPQRATRRKGIRITKGGRFFFVDFEDARQIADALHDITDRHEQENTNG